MEAMLFRNRRTGAASPVKRHGRSVCRWSPPNRVLLPGWPLVPLATVCLLCGCSGVPRFGYPPQATSSHLAASQNAAPSRNSESDAIAERAEAESQAAAVPGDAGGRDRETVARSQERPSVDGIPGSATEPSREALTNALRSPRAAERIAALEQIEGNADAGLETAVRGALTDADLGVRLAAVAALGRIASPTARQELRRLAESDGEAFRAAAVTALVAMGDKHALRRAASDRSPYVRLRAARLLAEVQPSDAPDDEVTAAAWRLLHDGGGDVQAEVMRSTARWPWRHAAPLYLEGLASQVYAVRKAAHERLSERWPPARDFPWQLAPAESAALLESVREEFARSFPPDGEHETEHPDAIPVARLPSATSPEEQP